MYRIASAKSVLMAATLSLAASVAIAQEQPAAPAQNLPAIIVTAAESRDLVDRIVSTGTLRAEEEVQKLTDQFVKQIDAALVDKDKDIRTV